MPKKKLIPKLVRYTATIRAADSNLTMMQCLSTACGYSEDEWCNKTLQMAVYCLYREMIVPEQNPSIIISHSTSLQSQFQSSLRETQIYLLKWKKFTHYQNKHSKRDSTIKRKDIKNAFLESTIFLETQRKMMLLLGKRVEPIQLLIRSIKIQY